MGMRWACAPAPKYLSCAQNGIVEAANPGQLRLFNIQDMGPLMTDNFTFETTIKNEFDDGSNACHNVQLLIECKNDVIFLPLSAPSCAGDLALYFCGWRAESKSADLSGFGCDLKRWTTVRVETVNKQAKIYINGRKVYALTFTNEATGIVGCNTSLMARRR
ncbi:hypothetical protein MKQ70_06985 [Chitinophaga sedimenti]|uniref:hypothetical protein n=1 Tax=Chitinophaga sedimenti TaxID=2033606 RepID=UPI002005AC76|nr:hypothetical protein [Chitinophaga sedimenti]MCK7554758.1 hypothetical protein [Chitinophaga sedimenti]